MKKLDKKNIETIIALTPMQEGMLFHYLKEPESKLHREHLSLDISGKIDKNAFEQAWKTVTRNNEMLRTLFRWENVNAPVQVTLKEHQPYVNHFESWTQDQEIKDTEKTFDLSDVPFRVSLYKKTEDSYRVVISNHHILYDGWSNGIILKEFFSAYHVLRKGDAELLLPPSEKTPFETFLQWTRDRDDKGDRQFWSSYLEGSRQGTGEGLKTPESEDREVKNFELRFEPSLKSKLDDFTRQHKVTLATVLYSAWGFLLQSYSDSSDILYDTTVSGRSSKMKGIENSVGLFINTLPLRVNASSGTTITDVLQTVNRQLREREAVEHTSQLLLKEYLEDYAGQLAFDSILVIENYPLDALLDEINAARHEEGALAVTSFSAMGMTPYDVAVIITALDEIVVGLTYDNRLFDEDAIRTLSNHFTFIVDRIIAEPGTPPTGIQLSPENITEIIEKIEAGRTAANKETTVYVPPTNDVERRLTAIWSEVLKAHESKPIGIDHNFFDFGGHSLKASLLAARIHKAFNVKVPLAEIFKHPTIREMAVYIDGKKEADGGYVPIEPAKEKQHYELSSSQKRFYHLQQMNPESTAYNVSILMEIDRNPDSRVRASLSEAFKQLIQRHESLRTAFRLVEDEPVQQIHDEVAFVLE
ncbi:MAG: hypothetical protein GY940_39325, partial [bacterium]|nr:hypothetical protein [bacterium]